MAKVSLCLIARDEETLLRGALESVFGAVDELIVVDTGSTDSTREIARNAGALVIEHFWQDDFSAARNTALAHATGDWILVLDADERLAPGAVTAIRKGVEKNSFDCGLLPLYNASRSDATLTEVLEGDAQLGEPVLLPRLFRRSLDLRWEGVVHENVATWLAGDKTIAVLEAPIVHYGATTEVRSARDKDRRNLRLLERRCALEPRDPVARTYLVRELLRAEEGDRAHQEVERAWIDLLAAMSAAGDSMLRPSVVTTATLRTFLLLTQGRSEQAVDTLRIARSWGEPHPNFDLLMGNALLAGLGPRPEVETLKEIEAILRDAIGKQGRVYVEEVLPGATSYAARTELGCVQLLLGDLPAALNCFETALMENSKHEAASLGRLECLVHMGEVDLVLKELDPFLTESCPDAWIIAALLCAHLARSQDAAAMIATAKGLPGRCLGAHRSHLLARLATELHAKNILQAWLPDTEAVRLDSIDEAVERGELAYEEGAIESAQSFFMEALQQDIGEARSWTNLGVTYHALADHENAATALQIALALDPDRVDARLNLAQVMVALERPHAAVECLRGVLERESENELATELLRFVGVSGLEERDWPDSPQLSVILRVCETESLQRTLDWMALQDLEPSNFEVILCCDMDVDAVDAVLGEGRPFSMVLCDGIDSALGSCEGRWVLLLDPGALPAADCFRNHYQAHLQMGQSVAVVGAVELAVDCRNTPLLEVLASTSLLDDPMGLNASIQPRGGSGSCNYSVPREVLEGIESEEVWRGGLEISVLEGLGIKSIYEPAIRVYREITMDLEAYQSHCFQLGYNHFRLGCFYEQPDLLRSLVGADPAEEENWMLLRARLERQRDTIRSLWREASLVERSPLPSGDRRVEMVQNLHHRLRRIGAHAYEVGQAVAATGINPESMWYPSRLRTEMTTVVLMNRTGFPDLVNCLDSLRRNIKGPVEVIVADRGVGDGSTEWLGNQPDITLVNTEADSDSVARNRALSLARGRSVLFCDSSVVFTPFWREILLDHMEQWPDIGVVAPVSQAGQTDQYVEPGPLGAGGVDAFAQSHFSLQRGQHVYTAQVQPALVFIRMDLIERIGGFDERFDNSGLDWMDWCHRARMAGSRIRIARDCFMTWSESVEPQGQLEVSWAKLKAKWQLPDALKLDRLSDLPVDQGLFHNARAFVPYQSEDGDLDTVLNRHVKLLCGRNLKRKTA
jgi:glycosyltransferase involved in cell wall biosynthesis/tetratricopeptide (TPR) repeat protein